MHMAIFRSSSHSLHSWSWSRRVVYTWRRGGQSPSYEFPPSHSVGRFSAAVRHAASYCGLHHQGGQGRALTGRMDHHPAHGCPAAELDPPNLPCTTSRSIESLFRLERWLNYNSNMRNCTVVDNRCVMPSSSSTVHYIPYIFLQY